MNGTCQRRSGPRPTPVRERIINSIKVDANGCWRWQKYVKPNGYGQIGVPGQGGRYVHRVAYEEWVGPIPAGLHLDHLCRVRDCCNPLHLEAVSARINVLRGTGFAAVHAAVTHCPKGHPYDEANTYSRPRGSGRDCRACRSVSARRSSVKSALRVAGVPIDERTPSPGSRKTHCPQGHPLSGDNLYVDTRGTKTCRICRRDSVARSASKRRLARIADEAA